MTVLSSVLIATPQQMKEPMHACMQQARGSTEARADKCQVIIVQQKYKGITISISNNKKLNTSQDKAANLTGIEI